MFVCLASIVCFQNEWAYGMRILKHKSYIYTCSNGYGKRSIYSPYPVISVIWDKFLHASKLKKEEKVVFLNAKSFHFPPALIKVNCNFSGKNCSEKFWMYFSIINVIFLMWKYNQRFGKLFWVNYLIGNWYRKS